MKSSYRQTGFVQDGVRSLLRTEALAILLASTCLFHALHENWWLFVALFFAPDISFIAYWAGPRIGALTYNALHSYLSPLALILIGRAANMPAVLLPLSLIWIAHIGFDRAAGYGLKYATAFGDTHLGFKGRPVPEPHANSI